MPPQSSGRTGGERGQDLAGRRAGGDRVRCRRLGKVGSAAVQPSGRAGRTSGRAAPAPAPGRPATSPIALLPLARAPSGHARRPGGRAPAPPASTDEGHVRVEAEDLLGRRDLVVAERRAVRRAGVLLVRRGPADDRAQRRSSDGLPGVGLGRRDGRLPGATTSSSPSDSTYAARASRRPRSARPRPRTCAIVGVVLDRDVVVVVEHDQVAQLLVPGQARRPRRRRPPPCSRRRTMA
mgnify:CR=1 FL=1